MYSGCNVRLRVGVRLSSLVTSPISSEVALASRIAARAVRCSFVSSVASGMASRRNCRPSMRSSRLSALAARSASRARASRAGRWSRRCLRGLLRHAVLRHIRRFGTLAMKSSIASRPSVTTDRTTLGIVGLILANSGSRTTGRSWVKFTAPPNSCLGPLAFAPLLPKRAEICAARCSRSFVAASARLRRRSRSVSVRPAPIRSARSRASAEKRFGKVLNAERYAQNTQVVRRHVHLAHLFLEEQGVSSAAS